MDAIKSLVDTHINMSKLEKEIRKCRRNLIKECRNKSPSYISKISYTGFAAELKKEAAKFDKLLQDLETNENNESNESIEEVEIIDTMDSDSESTESETEKIKDLYRDSLPMTDNLSIDETQIKIEIEEKKEMEEINNVKPVIHVNPVNSVNPSNHSKSNENIVSNTKNSKTTPSKNLHSVNRKQKKVQKILKCKNNDNNNNKNEWPELVKISNDDNVKPVKSAKSVKAEKSMKPAKSVNRGNVKQINQAKKTGYKYEERGFRVFTGQKNRNRPIYGSTLLFCYETCGQNEKNLRRYLVKNGDFNKLKIEEITFRYNFGGSAYALIRVRGPINFIEEKIRTLNNRKKNEIITFFERRRSINYSDIGNTLYVNNFDILDRKSHKRFTNLFSKYGELSKYIYMGLDKLNDPFAIVQFENIEDAAKCIDGKIEFDGKILSVNYARN